MRNQGEEVRDEGVETGVELGRYVGGVAEHAHHQGPFHLEYHHSKLIRREWK